MKQEIYVKEMPKCCDCCDFYSKDKYNYVDKDKDCPLKSLHEHDKQYEDKINTLQSQLDQQKAMWEKLKDWLEYRRAENNIFDNCDRLKVEDDLILDKMQELEGEDE